VIPRRREIQTVLELLRRFPVAGIIGARLVGKTTSARTVARRVGGAVHYFDPENPQDLAHFADPMPALEGLTGPVVG